MKRPGAATVEVPGELWSRLVNDGAQSTLERVYVLVVVRDLFRDDAHLCTEVVKLCRRCNETDVDVDKVRSFAASAGDTISPREALTVIKGITEARIRNSTAN